MVFASVALAAAASGYELFGTATLVSPGNNSPTGVETVSDGPTDLTVGGIDFTVPADFTVADLERLSTDYKFTQGTCGGGSPRFQVNVTNGTDEGKIFFYIGPEPNYTGCTTGTWQNSGDLAEAARLVDTSQLDGGNFYQPFAAALAAYGEYEVTGIQLVTDGGWQADQTVIFDNVRINNTTYTFESKDSCKDGGWQQFTGAPGPFRNQGQCVSYFARGGQ
jgi:hypothetical protein